MATAAATGRETQRSAPAVGRHDRLFYGGMALAMALTVFSGFASTYYYSEHKIDCIRGG
jgi:hypothetical protein